MKASLAITMMVFLVRAAVVGVGSLGRPFVDALYQRGHRKIIATRRNESKLEEWAKNYNIGYTVDNCLAVEKSDVVILTVKPRHLEGVLEEIKDVAKDKLVLSLVAAKELSYLEDKLPNSRIARAMTGIFVSEEAAGYTLGSRITPADKQSINYILNDPREVTEKDLALRTWIACFTGLAAYGVEVLVEHCYKEGMRIDNARAFLGSTIQALGKIIYGGHSGTDLGDKVGGPDSFTEGLRQELSEFYAGLPKFAGSALKKLLP
jgi:pyrroline-5-carboxylate reductase